MTAFDSFWQLLTAFNSFWQLFTAFDSVLQLFTAFYNFWQLLTTLDNFWQLLTTYTCTLCTLSSSQDLVVGLVDCTSGFGLATQTKKVPNCKNFSPLELSRCWMVMDTKIFGFHPTWPKIWGYTRSENKFEDSLHWIFVSLVRLWKAPKAVSWNVRGVFYGKI